MNNKFKMLLKTTAAVATLMIGSQTWGSDAVTTYFPGAVNGTARYDTVALGAIGTLDGYTAPAGTVTTLYINLVEADNAAGANADTTAGPSFPSTVKDIWIMGNAAALHTRITTAAKAFPTPAAGSTIHFLLTAAANVGLAAWFMAALPATCSIIVEPGSADPRLQQTGLLATPFTKLTVGANLAIADPSGTPIDAEIVRHTAITEATANASARLTLAAATEFSKKVTGVSLAGAFSVTVNQDSEFVDISAVSVPTAFVVAAGKRLTIKGVAADTVYPASSAFTLGAGSKLTITK